MHALVACTTLALSFSFSSRPLSVLSLAVFVCKMSLVLYHRNKCVRYFVWMIHSSNTCHTMLFCLPCPILLPSYVRPRKRIFIERKTSIRFAPVKCFKVGSVVYHPTWMTSKRFICSSYHIVPFWSGRYIVSSRVCANLCGVWASVDFFFALVCGHKWHSTIRDREQEKTKRQKPITLEFISNAICSTYDVCVVPNSTQAQIRFTRLP